MEEPNYQAIIESKYGVKATSVAPFKSNVALIEQEDGRKAIFKCVRTDANASLIDRFRFKNEIRIYKVFQKSHFDFLHIPKLFSAGKDYILIEFVERDESKNVTEKDFVRGYYEFQNMHIPGSLKFDLFNQLTRGVWYRGIVVPILSLSKHVGFRKSLQAVALFLKLHLQTKRYKNKYWLHGDVAVRNMYYQQQTNDLFFIDFENVYFTRKWPLLEIIQRCFCYGGGAVKSFSFELDSLNYYLLQAKEHDNLELSNSNLFNQFRLSLFLSTISRIVRPKSKDKSTAFTLLLNVILNEKAFRTFYQKTLPLCWPIPQKDAVLFQLRN